MTEPAVTFPAPGRVPYPGGCVLEPGPFALDYLLSWSAPVVVAGVPYPEQPVFALLLQVLADPPAYGLTLAQAQAAQARFLELAGQALEAEGGQRHWLAREFGR